MRSRTSQAGQSLVELLVAIGIGIIFIVGAIGALTITLRLESQTRHGQPATELTAELAEQIRTIANDDWHWISGLTRNDSNAQYYVQPSGSFYALPMPSGHEDISLDNISYRRYFLVDDVYRDAHNSIATPPCDNDNPCAVDPSTLHITAVTEWDQLGQTVDARLAFDITRTRNRIWQQSDWSSGPNGDGPTTNVGSFYTTQDNINTTSTAGQLTLGDLSKNLETGTGNGIDPTYRYAWNDVAGWIDFLAFGNVTMQKNATTTGYVSSNMGLMALDCASSPLLPTPGTTDICSQALFGVTQDANRVLSGFAWNDGIGWISFNCASANNCASQNGVDYAVKVDGQGYLYGWAWNDTVGWISFNCDHSQAGDPLGVNTCPAGRGGNGSSADYAVKTGASTIATGTLDSMIFDTDRANGVSINTIGWIGVANGGGVAFQIATGNDLASVSTSSFIGPDGTSGSYYRPLAPSIPIKIDKSHHPDARYLRYRVKLESNAARTQSPRVDDIIINYSL